MRPGTPGFVGARLREAREAMGLTSATLADIVKVSRAAISQFENGHATPHPDVSRRLADILHVSPGYFLLPARAGGSNVFFRSRASLTLRARLRGARKIDRLADLVAALSESLRLPEVRFPAAPTGADDPLFLEDDAIEQAARDTRRFWGLGEGPISNLVWLLENNGTVVSRMDFHERQMDSWSRWGSTDLAPLIILNSDKASAARSRFDAAHELGHLVLHRFVPPSYWELGDATGIREQQAHLFASSFLMPENTFGAEVGFPSLDRFLALKPRWRTSIASMLKRSEGLGLISDEHARRLWQNLSRRHWKTAEPLDDTIAPEQPRLLPKAFAVLREMDRLAPSRIVGAAEVDRDEIVALAMLPPDFFESDTPNVVPFRSRVLI